MYYTTYYTIYQNMYHTIKSRILEAQVLKMVDFWVVFNLLFEWEF